MQSQGANILLVDDSEIIRRGTREILESFGYQVDAVDGGGEAIRAILGKKYDLILLDIEMPHIDGFQVFKRIRARDTMKTLPIIIFFTERTHLKLEGLHLGASDFIVKSLAKKDSTEFHARIEAHLKIAELIRRQVDFEKRAILKAATTSACHEIFNPLTVVNAGIEFVVRRFGEKESCRECVSMLGQARVEMERIQCAIKKISQAEASATMDYAGGGKMMDLSKVEAV